MTASDARMPIRFVLVTVYLSFTALLAVRMLFTLYALELGASAFEVGLLAAAQQLVPLFLSIGIGTLGDRFGARWLYAGGAAAGGLGLLLPYFFPGLPALFAAAVLCGLWSVCTAVLTLSLVGVLSPPEQLPRKFSNHSQTTSPPGQSGRAMGLRLTGNSLVRTAGPPVFGALAALLGLASVSLGTACLLGSVGWALWRGARNARPAPA